MNKTLLYQYCTILFFLFSSSLLWSQQFPITVNTILTTPALPHLESFISDNPTAVMVNVILTDPSTPEFDIGLRMTISGQGINITSDPMFFGDVYTLSANIPFILTGSELSQYFNPANLQFSGITADEYYNNGQLPEGFYSICFEAYDINTPNSLPISNKGCGIGAVEQFDPPIILNPLGESPHQEPQNYIFSWQPIHPAGFDVNYYLEIYEQIDGVADADILQYESPVVEIITTNFTTYVYSMIDPILEKNTEYIMRLQVVDPNGQFLFKNNGYGELGYFKLTENCVEGNVCDDENDCTTNDRYDENCACVGEEIPGCGENTPCDFNTPVVVEKATEINGQGFIANWSSETDCYDYLLLEVGRDTTYIGETESYILDDITAIFYTISDLDLIQGDYFYRLSGFINEEQSVFSENIQVSLNKCKSLSAEEMDYACGEPDSTIFNNSPLLTELPVGSMVYASDWLVEITKTSGSNSFTGKAKFTNDIFPEAQLNLVFKNIKVNEDCQMVEGFMEVEGFGLALISPEISNILDGIIAGIDMALSVVEMYEQVLNDINNILNQTDGINDLLTDEWNLFDGVDPIANEYPYLDSTATDAVQDALNCFLQFNNVDSCTQQLIDALADLQDAIEAMYDADYQVKFEQNKNSLYGYDVFRYPGTELVYDQVVINDQEYTIPWISIDAGGGSEYLDVSTMGEVSGDMSTRIENNFQPPEIVANFDGSFVMEEIELEGKEHEEKHQAYAYQEFDNDSVKIAGKVNIVSYDEIDLKVEIVEFANAKLPTDIDIADTLYNIFKSAMVNVKLTTKLLDQNMAAFQDTNGTSWYTNYTDEMIDVIDLIDEKDDVNYIILIPSHIDPSKLGYNPRGKQFGFIFMDNHNSSNAISKTIAHEIAHGRYNLQHPEQVFPDWAGGNTDLLMDNNGTGKHLAHYEWEQIQNPNDGFTLFDQDEEGEMGIDLSFEFFSDSLPNNSVFNEGDVINNYFFTKYRSFIQFSDNQFDKIDTFKFGSTGKYIEAIKVSNKIYVISASYSNDAPNGNINFICKLLLEENIGQILPGMTEPLVKYTKTINGDEKTFWKNIPANNEDYVITAEENISCVTGINYLREHENGGLYETESTDFDCLNGGGDSGYGEGIYVIDFAKIIDSIAVVQAIDRLSTTELNTGVTAKIFITDNNTKQEDLDIIESFRQSYTDREMFVVINFSSDSEYELSYHFGAGISEYPDNLKQQLLQASIEISGQSLQLMTDALDALSHLVGYLAIPEKYYNPTYIGYNEILVQLRIADFIVPGSGTFPLLDENFSDLKESTVEQCQFALVAGAYNGLVDQLKGLPETASLLIKVLVDAEMKDSDGNPTGTTAREMFSGIWDGFIKDCQTEPLYGIPCGFSKLWKLIKDKHTKENLSNSALLYYQIGIDVSNFATFALAFAKVGSLAKVNILLESLDATSYVFRGAAILLRYALVTTNTTYRFGKAGTKLAITTGQTSSIAVYRIIKQELEIAVDKTIDLLAPNSNLAWSYSNNRVFLGVDDMSNSTLKEVMDEAQNKIEDAYGNFLVEIKRTDVNGDVNSNLALAKHINFTKFDELVDFHKANPSVLDELNGLTGKQKVALEADLGDANFRIHMEGLDDGVGVKAWKKVTGRAYSTDVPFLEKLSEIMEPSVLNKLPNGEADLDGIIAALVHPHTGASHTFMKQAAEHLDDVKHFINNFDHLSGNGFEDVISALRNPNFYAQDGASHMLTKLKSIDASQVSRMEGKIIDADNLDGICANCLFDIELVGGKKLELKSYSKTTIEKISTNSKFKNQFKAYLADAQNFNSYEYIFSLKKATDFDLTFVKENFQSLFSKNNHEIFDQIGGAQNSLMQSLGIANKSDFIDAVSDLGDDLYKFIKIE